MADQVGLFIWINDVPISGSVLKLSNIVFPRSDYSSYAVGQNVTVKCPGFGKHDAVIAKIGGKNLNMFSLLTPFFRLT